jgi:hypothetical protein
LKLILTKYAIALSARDAKSTLRTVTPMLGCAGAFFEQSRLTQI